MPKVRTIPLNIVGARPAMGKTAFGLGLATHIAKHEEKPALVFSLEMGHAEITQRILASEAKVDSTKLRTGRLNESDWSKVGLAVGRLEIPLFLDDNPQVTVMEIRAKSRRIKAQYGSLGMIAVDYIQLMGGSGSAENRQLEVSEISRNLKILAREGEKGGVLSPRERVMIHRVFELSVPFQCIHNAPDTLVHAVNHGGIDFHAPC